MNTLQDDWKQYRDRCYPKGIPALQDLECHQAFFAGALFFHQQMQALAAMPESQAEQRLHKLIREVWEINAANLTRGLLPANAS